MKVISKNNFRVIIEPATWYKRGHEKHESDAQKTCEEIIESIKRHVDDIESIHWECETNTTCSFCGLAWEEDIDGEPLCCDKAQYEFNNKK
jgi:hypothetical protein